MNGLEIGASGSFGRSKGRQTSCGVFITSKEIDVMQTCFIAMLISTHDLSVYGEDADGGEAASGRISSILDSHLPFCVAASVAVECGILLL